MAVLYDDRTLPLTPDAGSPYTSTHALAWDFTGIGSLAEGEAFDFAGATNPALVKTGTITLVTRNGIPGRKANTTSLYEYTNTTDYGLQVGSGDWQIMAMFSTPSTLPATNGSQVLFEVRNAGGTVIASVSAVEFAANGWYMLAASPGMGTSVAPVYYGTDKTVIFCLRRRAGVVSGWTMEASATGTLTRRYTDGASSTVWDNASATRVRAVYNSSTAVDTALHCVRFWAGSFDDAGTQAIGRDFWALDENDAVADSIAITSPTTGGSVATTTTISGTYTYASGAPAGIQVQQGAGAWTALSGFTASGGTWSGSLTLTPGSGQTLRARDSGNTGIVSPDVTGITVTADSIAFTAQNYGTYGNMQAVAHRIFQRDVNDDAVGVRVVGTYSGSPTTIQWRFNGGAWVTLDATPAGGVFDETVTLTGPAQGALEVRFSNQIGVSAGLSNVGVGDVFICAGQSNHVGAASNYVTPVAPSAHPTWVPTKFAKDHTWQPIAESSGDKFDDETATYAAYGSGSPGGSYFGALGTLIMDAGVPAAFVPCAKGSTTIDSWAVGAPVTNTATLFGATASTALLIGSHRAVLWQQGESEGSGTGDASLLADKLDVIIDQWQTTVGTPWYVNIPPLAAMGGGGSAVTARAELASMPGLNAAVLAAIDLDGDYTGIHYETGVQINAVADDVFAALNYPAAPPPPPPPPPSVSAGGTSRFVLMIDAHIGIILPS